VRASSRREKLAQRPIDVILRKRIAAFLNQARELGMQMEFAGESCDPRGYLI